MQWLKSQAHLKWDVSILAMESSIVVVLNTGETLIPCTWMLEFVHAQNVHNHHVNELHITMILGVVDFVSVESNNNQRLY